MGVIEETPDGGGGGGLITAHSYCYINDYRSDNH